MFDRLKRGISIDGFIRLERYGKDANWVIFRKPTKPFKGSGTAQHLTDMQAHALATDLLDMITDTEESTDAETDKPMGPSTQRD